VTPNHFVYRLIPPRPTFAGDMNEAEMAIMAEHAEYWTELFDKGRVVVFGVVLEPAGSWGLAVVDAESEEDVRALGLADPAVRSGTCTFEIGTLPDAAVRPAPTAV
jgi:uncharacterized protein YciI